MSSRVQIKLAAAFLFLTTYGLCTSIVVLWTSNYILVAADGKSVSTDGLQMKRCKIVSNESADTFFAMSGAIRGNTAGGKHYDLELVCRRELSTSGVISERVRRFRKAVLPTLALMVSDRRRLGAQDYQDWLQGVPIFEVSIVTLENGMPTVYFTGFGLDKAGQISSQVFNNTARSRSGVWLQGIRDHMKGQDIDRWMRTYGETEGLRLLIQMEIDTNPETVGPPISIVRLDPVGHRWVQPGVCPTDDGRKTVLTPQN
jgi:hypothetical protein